MWTAFSVCHLLLCGIQIENALTAYYRRKPELGYFSIHLATVGKPSRVQCAGACKGTDGCSVASFSQDQKLCKLSSGTGVYIVDQEWTSYLLHTYYITTTEPMTSHTNGITTTPTDTMTSHPGSTFITMTSHPADISTTTTGTVTSHVTEFSTTTSSATTTPVIISTTTTATTTTEASPACPSPYTTTPSGFCFYIIVPFHNFGDVQQMCHNNGGYLATIGSKRENFEVVALLQSRTDLSRDVYLGATDHAVEGTWRWLTDAPFIDWMSGYATNFHSLADCLAYSLANQWEWRDVICSREYHAVCEADPQ